MPHGRKSKKPKSKQPRKRKKKVRPIDPGFGRDVCCTSTPPDMLTPLRPAPNWLTQRAPPFVPYDPWQEHRRHTRMVDARNRAQMRREIQAEQGGGAVAHAGYGQYG